jgi:hypothetical protein
MTKMIQATDAQMSNYVTSNLDQNMRPLQDDELDAVNGGDISVVVGLVVKTIFNPPIGNPYWGMLCGCKEP